MSESQNLSSHQGGSASSGSGLIVSCIAGLVIGTAGTWVGMQSLGYKLEAPPRAEPDAAAPSGGPAMPSPTGGGGGAGGGGGMMGGGGGGMMGGGGMGGGGGAGAGKRNLTTLVGKLELLSRTGLNLHVELDAQQAEKIAGKLAEMDKSEKMTADEAQSHLDAMEALLTPEQKETLALIGLPTSRPGGGGRAGGGGPPGGGGAGGGAPMMGMMGGGSPDDNPFTQEANQKRLRDLLARLNPASAESASAAP